MKKLIIAGITLGLAAFMGNTGYAVPVSEAPITFGTPGTFTDDSVIIQGPLTYAISVGNGTPVTNVGPQGITFQADANNSNPNVVFTPFSGTVANYGAYLPSGTSGNVGFDTVLSNGAYNGTVNAGTTITLNNLVVNRSYEVEVFVDDTRVGSEGRTFTVTGINTTTPQVYAFEGGTPALGAYVTGTFTADSTSENFEEDVQSGGDDFQVNGIVLDVTNYALELTPGLTPNQTAVASNLDGANLTGGLGPVITTIANGPVGAIGSELDQLSPEKLQIYRNIAFDNFGFTVAGLDNHLASLRYGQGGFDTSGLAILNSSDSPLMSQIKSRLLAFNPAPMSGLISDSADPVLGGVKMTDPKDMKQMAAPIDLNRWSVFVDGSVVLADLSHNADDTHADYTTGGVMAGVDYRLDDNFAVGGLFGYGHTDATLDNDGSHAHVDSYSPGLYATYANHGWYANGLAAYNYNSYGQNRAIPVAGLNANGNTDGNQYNGNLDGGYEFHSGNWTYGPTLGVQYVHLDINSFTESGAGPLNLNVNDQQDDSLRSRLGGEVRYQVRGCGDVIFTPHLSASWQHEYLDNSRGITSQFNGSGLGSFTVQGTNEDRDAAFIDVGLDTQVNKTVSCFLDYQTQAGQDDFFAQSVQAGVKIGF